MYYNNQPKKVVDAPAGSGPHARTHPRDNDNATPHHQLNFRMQDQYPGSQYFTPLFTPPTLDVSIGVLSLEFEKEQISEVAKMKFRVTGYTGSCS